MLLDTLGWIQHLLGHEQDALASMRIAVAGAPNSAEVRWHAAVVSAATDDLAVGSTIVAVTSIRSLPLVNTRWNAPRNGTGGCHVN